ncbi:MAG: hypothetical protein ABR981_05880 [Candidatus Micrarchaeaceae archaeon]
MQDKKTLGPNENLELRIMDVTIISIVLFLVLLLIIPLIRNGFESQAGTASVLNNTAFRQPLASTSVSTTIKEYIECHSEAGYLCINPAFIPSAGVLRVGIGQTTGNDWNNVSIVFVPQKVPNFQGIPNINWNSSNVSYVSTIPSGSYSNVTLQISSQGTGIGTMINGTIWARYYLNDSNSTVQYTGMAAVHLISG